MRLPESLIGQTPRPDFSSLGARDLYRGHSVALPSGEAIARVLRLVPCNRSELKTRTIWSETPLWLWVYVISEHSRPATLTSPIFAENLALPIY